MIQLSIRDINLLVDALARGAARHESIGAALKPGGHFAAEHDRRAAGMRDLRARLLRLKVEYIRRPPTLELKT